MLSMLGTTSGKGHLALAVFRCFSSPRASWDIPRHPRMSQDALGQLKHLKTARARWPFPDVSAFVLFWTWRIQQNRQVWSRAAEEHSKEFWSHDIQTNIDLDKPTSANVLQRVVWALEIYCGFWNCSHCNLLNIPNENDVNTSDIASQLYSKLGHIEKHFRSGYCPYIHEHLNWARTESFKGRFWWRVLHESRHEREQ